MAISIIDKTWKDVLDNQMITFTDLQTSGLVLNNGQSPITSLQCITRSQIQVMYNVDIAKLQIFANNQLIPKTSNGSISIATGVVIPMDGLLCCEWVCDITPVDTAPYESINQIIGILYLSNKLLEGEGIDSNDSRTNLSVYSYTNYPPDYNPTPDVLIPAPNTINFIQGENRGYIDITFSGPAFGNVPPYSLHFQGTIITTTGRNIYISNAYNVSTRWDYGEQNYDTGEWITFPRSSSGGCCPGNCVAGSDITIGSQIWTACNANHTTYADGTPIPNQAALNLIDPNFNQWESATTGRYMEREIGGGKWGKFYNWYAIAGIWNEASKTDINQRKIFAPYGYHVPSREEWATLSNNLGGNTVSGGKLKQPGLCNWDNPNYTSTPSGFDAIPGGSVSIEYASYTDPQDPENSYTYEYAAFRGKYNDARFWSSTVYPDYSHAKPLYSPYASAWHTSLFHWSTQLHGSSWNLVEGYSVRLIYDGLPGPPVASMRFKNFVDNNYDALVYGRTYYVNTKEIELPLMPNGSYNFTVNWGDGTPPQQITNYSQRFHTYTTNTLNWDYTVTLTGVNGGIINGWSYADISDDQCLLINHIYSWGSIKFINPTSGNSRGGFYNCKNLKMDQCKDAPNFGTISSLNSWFTECTKLGRIGGIENWNVSNITDMSYMFANIMPTPRSYNPQDQGEYNLFNFTPQNLSNWNTSKVTNMTYMFYNCRHNNNIGGWDVSKVTDMERMFKGATSFNNGGSDSIKNWNTASLVNCYYMFYDCKKFNQPLDNFNFTNVRDISHMFFNCYEFNQNLSTWERPGATMQYITSQFFMFGKCRKFNGAVNTWNTRSLTSFQGMFYSCYEFNQPMNSWNTQSLNSAQGMLQNAFAFNQPLGNWNLSSMRYGGFSTYLSAFHGIGKGDPDRPGGRTNFDLQPETLRQTLLGWANTLHTGGGYIHFPSSANDGNCTGISRTSTRGPGINSKGWNIYWLDGSQSTGESVDNGVATSADCPFNWNG